MLHLLVSAHRGDIRAVEQITSKGSKVVPELVRLLQYRDSSTTLLVTSIRNKLPRFLQPLLGRSPSFLAPEVQIAATAALGRLGPDAAESAPALVGVMHEQGALRWEAANALAKIGPEAITHLQAACSDPDMRVRHAAAYSLGLMGLMASASVPELILIVETGDEPARSSAAYSLTLIGPEGISAIRRMQDRTNTNRETRVAARLAAQANPAPFLAK